MPISRMVAGSGIGAGTATATTSGITWPDDIVAVAEFVVPLKKSSELAPVIIFVMKSTGTVVSGE